MVRKLYILLGDAGILYKGEDFEKFQGSITDNHGRNGLISYVIERAPDYISISKHVIDKIKLCLESNINDTQEISIADEGLVQALKSFI